MTCFHLEKAETIPGHHEDHTEAEDDEKEEEEAGKEDNDEWQDMPDDEAEALIKAGEAAVAKYMKFKKDKKKDD